MYNQIVSADIKETTNEEYALVTAEDFEKNSPSLEALFTQRDNPNIRLSKTESNEIKRVLNPNTNIKNYIAKTLPREYQEAAESKSQSKQKFKGPMGSGKTLLLSKRVIHCADRLTDAGRILAISGDHTKVNHLKDLITAESSRSLQELGVDVLSYPELVPPIKKYQALFIDDAQYIETTWIKDLLQHYLIDMSAENDYEYVVMADQNHLLAIPKIFGPYRTLNQDMQRINKMLSSSCEIFLEILES